MAAATLGRLGPLYKSIGLDTKPELVAGRLKVAQGQFKKLGTADVVLLTRTALKMAKPAELVDFIAPYQAADPTFQPASGSREVAILAASILSEAISGTTEFSEKCTLAVTAAGFGGLRTYADPELLVHATANLARLQKRSRIAPGGSTYTPIPDLGTKFEELSTAGASNQFDTGIEPIKELLEGALEYTKAGDVHLARQLQVIIDHQRLLQEEMNVQWWVFGGWSSTVNSAFRDVKLPEASILAGTELGALTTTPVGLMAAPALLNRTIQDQRKHADTASTLADYVLAVSPEFRNEWAADLKADSPEAALLPATCAASLVVETEGQEDWQPRFKRIVGVAADVKISAPNMAMQVYREALLKRLIVAKA
jgi:hypothetical protein